MLIDPVSIIVSASAGIRLYAEIREIAQEAKNAGRQLTAEELDQVKSRRKQAMQQLDDAIDSRRSSTPPDTDSPA